MSSDDKWLDDEPPPNEEELREAESFGTAVDHLLAGEPTGPRDELVQASQMIRAAVREERLAEERRNALIEQAMRAALARPASRARPLTALVALAASLLLAIGVALTVWKGAPSGPRHAAPPVPEEMLSRSSNELMGRPFADRAGASQRLDLVFADRMSGYRQVRLLARGTP
jgi:hypothetical protein